MSVVGQLLKFKLGTPNSRNARSDLFHLCSVELVVHSFMTTTPNELVATIHPKRMPVMLTTDGDFDCWLKGSTDEARWLLRSFPAEMVLIVQASAEKKDLSLPDENRSHTILLAK